eukprot:scaffold92217_cov69-Phaeocystis_antarctica.AAC.6
MVNGFAPLASSAGNQDQTVCVHSPHSSFFQLETDLVSSLCGAARPHVAGCRRVEPKPACPPATRGVFLD